jgi:hypothetical protein
MRRLGRAPRRHELQDAVERETEMLLRVLCRCGVMEPQVLCGFVYVYT